jgi:uncharacterized protein (TIGR02594 family)
VKFLAYLKNIFKKKVVVVAPKIEEKSAVQIIASGSSWFDIATKELGTKEVQGSGNNPRIIEYHSATTLKSMADEVPWCSAFVCWCLEKSGYSSTKSAWARSFLNYGIKLDEPKVGCIVVFDRGNGYGHVGFYVSEAEGKIKLLGGNQSDAVTYDWFKQSKVLGYRWPTKIN